MLPAPGATFPLLTRLMLPTRPRIIITAGINTPANGWNKTFIKRGTPVQVESINELTSADLGHESGANSSSHFIQLDLIKNSKSNKQEGNKLNM